MPRSPRAGQGGAGRLFAATRLTVVWTLALSMLAGTAVVWADDGSAAAFRAFGLEGVWSPDCRRPPSRDNPRVVWFLPPGRPIFHGVTFDGQYWALTDTVAGASILGGALLQFTAIRAGEPFLTATIERVGARIHAIRSLGAHGEVYVQNGIDMQTGRLSLFDERCDLPVPIS